MTTPDKTTAEEQLYHVLQLAQEARIASAGPQWKTDTTTAVTRHGDACEALWDELYRLLDERNGVSRVKLAADDKKIFRKAVTIRLREAFSLVIPDLVEEACNV